MNLHFIPDDKYVGRFIERINLLGLSANNSFIVKSPPPYKHLSSSLNGARAGSAEFRKITGDPGQYEQLFVHFMDEPSVDLIVNNKWSKVNWLAWGADVYESLFGTVETLDESTKAMLNISPRSKLNRFVYNSAEKIIKYNKFRSAYSKVDTMGNWIKAEYEFALKNLPGLAAKHRTFFYDVDISFETLHAKSPRPSASGSTNVRVIVGQSAMPAANHIGALNFLGKKSSIAEVIIPSSYGSVDYSSKLEREVANQNYPFPVTFLKTYQTFENYLALLESIDIIILNSIRPAGLGNFWIGIFLGKAVFLRKENLAFQMLRDLGLRFFSMDEWNEKPPALSVDEVERNRTICLNFFSEERINDIYAGFFR